jgi:hypothetical protein
VNCANGCLLGDIGGARLPSKSTLQSYGELVDAAGLQDVVMHLVQQATAPSRQPEWSEPVTVETVFLGSTANRVGHALPCRLGTAARWRTHLGVRTLVKAILLIRNAGPLVFKLAGNRLGLN